MKLIVFDEASEEAAEAAVWYESKQAGAGDRFLTDFDRALTELENSPLRFPVLETISHSDLGLRRVMLTTFPYLVIYQIVVEEIRVIAIAHAARQPDYWKNRLKQRERDKDRKGIRDRSSNRSKRPTMSLAT